MRSTASLAVLAAAVVLLLPAAADASPGRGGAHASPTYTSPANILRGQRALESLGRLTRGQYSPGEYDETTRWAIRTYQRRYGLVSTGSFDFDTFAMLPIDERPDADDDGIPDDEDRCPATPNQAGPKKDWVRVGHDGCQVER